MDRPTRPALPWEHKAVIGFLLLLSLQQFHEVVLLVIGKNSIGLAHLDLFSPLLLIVFLSLALGMFRQDRRGWWATLLIMSAVALVHLAIFWTPVRNSLVPQPTRIAMVGEYEWLMGPRLTPLGLFWVIARSALMLFVPAVLLLGELRKSLKSS
jgi:hypothetical protein